MKVEIKGFRHLNKKYIEINGEEYVLDDKDEKDAKSKNNAVTVLSFKKFSAKKYEKLADELAEKLSEKTNVKEILKQALFDLPLSQMVIIQKELEKEKPFIRNNKGCVSITIGKANLPIRN